MGEQRWTRRGFDGQSLVIDERGDVVCSVYGSSPGRNLALIEAAPELLAALERLLGDTADWMLLQDEETRLGGAIWLTGAIEDVQAAFAKAKGE